MQYLNCPEVAQNAQNVSLKCCVKDVATLFDELLRIPSRQRAYDFSLDEMEKLLYDLFSAWDSWDSTNPQSYLLGGILLLNNSTPRLDVIDGQQRITSICLMIGAIKLFMKNKEKFTKFLKGRLERDHLDMLELGNDLNNTFFSNVIIGELGPEYYQTQTFDFDKEMTKLDDGLVGLVNSISSKNMARNYLFCINFFKKYLNGDETKLDNFYTFLKYGLSFIVTKIQGRDEWKIFETINKKGRELNPLDVLKGNFIDSVTDSSKKNTFTDQWNEIYQALGEIDFSVLIYAIALTKIKPQSEMKLPSLLELKNTIEELANNSFFECYLNPLNIALKSITDPSTSMDISRELEKFKFLRKNLFNASQDKESFISSLMIMTLLCAIYNAKKTKTQLFTTKCWDNVSQESIIYLIKSWNCHLLFLLLSDTKNVKFWGMSEMINAILNGNDINKLSKKTFGPPCLKRKKARDILIRQSDQKQIYEICFKLILFNNETKFECFSELDHLKAQRIYTDKPDTSTQQANRWKQIGNYALVSVQKNESERLDDMKEWNSGCLALPRNDDLKILNRTNLLIDRITDIACKIVVDEPVQIEQNSPEVVEIIEYEVIEEPLTPTSSTQKRGQDALLRFGKKRKM